MNSKRVLIVDDDPDLLFLVAHGVKSLSPDFKVSTAANGAIALDQAQKQKFDLIVTDHMMPETTGLELIQKASQFSPETRFILMTAHYDTNRMRNEVGELNLAAFVGKPFTMPELLKVVEGVITPFGESPEPDTSNIPTPREAVQEQLKNLRRQTDARSVLLVDSDGSPVHIIGNNDRARAARLAAFISSNFLSILELATLFGDSDSVFTSSYYEGNDYNIYAYNINGDYFLTVVFDTDGKPGTVWFYTKQAATTLASLLPASKTILVDRAYDTLAKDFEDLLGGKVEP